MTGPCANLCQQFSWHRLMLFIRSDLLMNSTKIFTFGITIFVILLLYGLLYVDKLGAVNFYSQLFIFVLCGGFWSTSHAFSDLHDPHRKLSFLMLPASTLEKFLGRLILTSVGYVVGSILIFYISSLIIAGFSWIVFSKITPLFQPMHQDIVHYFAIYVFLHALFFLGAIYFKTSRLSKTILCLGVFALSFLLLVTIIGSCYKLILAVMVIFSAWLIAYLRLCESEV